MLLSVPRPAPAPVCCACGVCLWDVFRALWAVAGVIDGVETAQAHDKPQAQSLSPRKGVSVEGADTGEGILKEKKTRRGRDGSEKAAIKIDGEKHWSII